MANRDYSSKLTTSIAFRINYMRRRPLALFDRSREIKIASMINLADDPEGKATLRILNTTSIDYTEIKCQCCTTKEAKHRDRKWETILK